MNNNLKIEWDKLDDFQKNISAIAYETENILVCCYHLEDLYRFIDTSLDFINSTSPAFFSEVINAFKYKIIVGTMKLYDKRSSFNFNTLINLDSKKAIKINIKNFQVLQPICQQAFYEIKKYDCIIDKLRSERNQYFAHLEKNFFDYNGELNLFDSGILDSLKQLLNWTWETLRLIMNTCGADFPEKMPVILDVSKLKKLQ